MSVRGTHIPEHLRLPIAGVTPPPTEKDGQRLFPTGNFRFFRPVYRDKKPPCNHACPTGEQIQKYLDFVKHDRYLDGYATILEDNPMPSVTGRVCYHPCETACNRAEHDEPIGIRSVERFLGDYGLALAEQPISTEPLNGKRVAIVGSGPGGLACAYHLRRMGYASVIFEALGKPGGMLRAGIPAWHLPEDILDQEIAKILNLGGIEIRCDTRVDDLAPLAAEYDAVFLALGQDIGRKLPGVEAARGVIGALEFLRETGLGRPVTIGRNVLVIGGGNTASDAARSAIRLGDGGQAAATIVSLEAEHELLIQPEDLDQAREEGVQFRPNSTLVQVHTDADGNVSDAVLAQARLVRDADGVVRAEVEPGTEATVECDTILVAIGQVQVLDWLPDQYTERGLIKAENAGVVFAGGDAVRGPSMVVDALGDGKRAAHDIHHVLGLPSTLYRRTRARGHAVRAAQHRVLPARGPRPGPAYPAGRPGEITANRGHPRLLAGGGRPGGGPLHVLRRLQWLRQLLHRVPGRQRDARHPGERQLLDPHPLLQGLPGLRAGMPDRLPGEGAGDGLRRTGRGGPDGDRVRAVRGRSCRAGAVHPAAHRGRDCSIRPVA